ncbi:MAG: hypothetical protein MRY32_01995 [Rickettsiales bacterium]|nr:hypothetical protein [Rickettsiales bacterium]
MNAKTIIQAVGVFLILLLFVWLAFYALILAAIIGTGMAVYVWVRGLLQKQGIIDEDAPDARWHTPFVNIYQSARSRMKGEKEEEIIIDADYSEVKDADEQLEDAAKKDGGKDGGQAA